MPLNKRHLGVSSYWKKHLKIPAKKTSVQRWLFSCWHTIVFCRFTQLFHNKAKTHMFYIRICPANSLSLGLCNWNTHKTHTSRNRPSQFALAGHKHSCTEVCKASWPCNITSYSLTLRNVSMYIHSQCIHTCILKSCSEWNASILHIAHS